MRSRRSKHRRRTQRGGLFGFFNEPDEEADGPLCQCPQNANEDPCRNPVIKGTLFCEEHQSCRKPEIGDELPYKPDVYKPWDIKLSHNCLAYALRILDPHAIKHCRKSKKNCRDEFKQPGNRTGERDGLSKDSRLKCPIVERMLLKDYPSIQKSTFYKPCPRGFRKIAGVVDKGNDHHWYARHSKGDTAEEDGYWDHKSGELDVTKYDAKGQLIFNPRQASRDYTKKRNSNLNYEDFCGFYCVPVPPQGQVVTLESLPEERQALRASRRQARQERRAQRTRRQERKTRRARY